MKKFTLTHNTFGKTIEFTFETAPDWLTSANEVRGSTMDNSWFYNDYVQKLEVGQSVETDIHTITRIE